MKKILSILVLGMIVSALGIGTAAAITVDGTVSPGDEWDTWYMRGTDPNEYNVDPNNIEDIADDYDIAAFYAWWDDTTVYLRTDVYGTPTLAKQGTAAYGTYYQWVVDTSGDEVGDFYVKLQNSGSVPQVTLHYMDDTSFGTGTGVLGDIVEVSFLTSDVPEALEPENDSDISMYVFLDNAGPDADDILPDEGWVHTVPEPASMLLLGFGLIGLAGGKMRKRFTV